MRSEQIATAGLMIRYCVLLGFCFAGGLAFAVGAALGNVDLDTTLPLSTAAFWQFAHSQDFYRNTRQQTSTVRQEVVELSNWVQADDPGTEVPPASATPRGPPRPQPGRVLLGRSSSPPSSSLDRQQQEHEQLEPRLWRRRARLTYAISSPFGSSDATVVQEHTLLEQPHEADDGGGRCTGGGGTGDGRGVMICYSESDCITGFPMVPGNLSVKTTFLVTPAEDGDPKRVRVRVGVVVDDIELPRRLQFLSKRVSKMIGNGGIKQAEGWLAEMIKAGSLMAETTA